MFEAVRALQGNQVVQALRNLFHAMHERDIGVSQSPAALDPIDLRTSLHALDHEKFGLGVHSSTHHFGSIACICSTGLLHVEHSTTAGNKVVLQTLSCLI